MHGAVTEAKRANGSIVPFNRVNRPKNTPLNLKKNMYFCWKKHLMGFNELPIDLKNIISAFAYDCKWHVTENDLEMCEKIKSMDLSSVFVRDVMWSKKYKEYLPCPLKVFEPISNFTGDWFDYFDWHSVQEFLWRLDFRRRWVKFANSRCQWRTAFVENWQNIKTFDDFYRFLLYTRVPCFKPLWNPCGFNGLKSYRSPHVSARWWLEHNIG